MADLVINDRESWVNDSIDGALYTQQHNNLSRLDFGNDIKVIARSDWRKDKVAIICGGGSGHEPAHAGFVGKGMLTAAVCGDLFAAPSVDAVLNAILHVTGDAGCLVIIKNYTGDRLNFGLACEKAKEMGRKVEMVIVSDDISIPDNPKPRGIAGTLFVHKVAGYVAEQGEDLAAVTKAAQDTIDATASIGIALQSCTLPSDNSEERIAKGKAELGLGIHGEAGIETIDLSQCKELVRIMSDKLLTACPSDSHAVLINNLGGLSPIEMNVVAKDVVESALGENAEYFIGPAPLMTAIDMKGFSISMLKLDELKRAALFADSQTSAWPGVSAKQPLAFTPCESLSSTIKFDASQNDEVASALRTVCNTIIDSESALNHLDAIVGDGDTGSTFASGARKVLAELDANQLPLNEPALLMTVIGQQLTTVMGGSSGVLLSIFFTAAGRELAGSDDLVAALQAGLARMMHYGGAAVGDRTMIDALFPAFEAWKKDGFAAGVLAAKAGAESTLTMTKANAGRSSYLNSDTLNGVKDPGAFAVEKVFESLSK
ncbi:DAK2 domain-containing protein [Agarivorans sp. B2Z047]|uniref:dihydroxyacetone kinase subunit DhaK n=1 Tax=Agarivorans sp. B2Z047 TaxID=2652721 RepID=UPI00128D609F|nr:dihydroxyacetone kinase subunit DhaK [Agarivorans sp. B2Z047]MPW28115.1 DAK2 domain-containing protein [Agarivorans sp. B2Z047]UQN44053.1 dihydroxyacetone kinase subunit DhaK [Agarivorans sp. B2Z047]